MKKLLLSLVAILFAINAYAQPSTITYQGVLTNASGELIDGSRDITFKIYNASSGGSALWTEAKSAVGVANGLFTVELGLNPTFASENLDFAIPYWLEIVVDPSDANVTLSPRVAFNANGYSFNAENATSATTATNFTGSLVGDVSGTQGATVIGARKSNKRHACRLNC